MGGGNHLRHPGTETKSRFSEIQRAEWPRWRRIAIQRKRASRWLALFASAVCVAYIWMGLENVARAASLTASDIVGCAWQVRARSSEEPPNSIRTAASWIISPAPKP